MSGTERIERASVALTVRVHGPHALSVQYVVPSREAGSFSRRERHQSVETVSLAYNFLGHTRFGAVDWRPDR